jgi:phosphotransferase family enzyme
MTMADLTDTIDELTPAWFTDALHETGSLATDAEVVKVDAHRFGVGGQLATVIRAELEYSNPNAGPPSVIVKQPSVDEGSRQMGVGLGMYLSEIRFYEDVAHRVGITVPRRHWSGLDPQSGRFTLVIEDLSGRAEPGDMLVGATDEQIRAVLAEVVKLQAPLWNDPWLLDQEWMTDLTASRMLFGAVPHLIEPFIERFGDRLCAEDLDLIRAVGPHSPEAVDLIWSPPFVVGHGDFRLDNMIFGHPGEAPPVCLLDWQTCGIATPGLDVAVFLATCVDIERRRSQEKDLLCAWVDGLAAAGVADFGSEAAYASYRTASLYPLLMCVATATTLEQTERGDRMWAQLIAGAVALVRDTGAAALVGVD